MPTEIIMPNGYKPLLDARETETAIHEVKEFFQTNLAFELNLVRVTAPLFVPAGTGINDDLNGIERPASFRIKGMNDLEVQFVQSLAKWKRMALADLGFATGEGLYTDMNAIRPDEILDNTHSIYVDQWDWERVIQREDRSVDFLKRIAGKVYDVIRRTEKYVAFRYPRITPVLPDSIRFMHAQELADAYPDKTPREREIAVCREHGAVFIIGIGGDLSDGRKHDGRAPDYDDWSTPGADGRPGLNGDIFVWNPVLETAFELSSMGIRVDREALLKQLELEGARERAELLWHKRLLNGELPLSIGGGIGQSRLSMFYLRKAHVGEIQVSIWPEEMVRTCRDHGITLL